MKVIYPLLLKMEVLLLAYPKWLTEGYLDSWYLKIAVGTAVYGGFIAALVWVIKDVKRRGW